LPFRVFTVQFSRYDRRASHGEPRPWTGVMSIPAPPPPHNPQVLEAEKKKSLHGRQVRRSRPCSRPTAHRSPLSDQQAGLPQRSLPTAHSPLLSFSNPQN